MKSFRFNLAIVALAGAASLVLTEPTAHAQVGTPGLTVNSVGASGSGGPYTLGWGFSLSTSIQVTDLGYFDLGGDGLAGAHQLGLWDSGGTLLASATVPAGTGAPLNGLFRYVALSTPVSLLSGQSYVVGGTHSSGVAYLRCGFDFYPVRNYFSRVQIRRWWSRISHCRWWLHYQ